jgi:hypothetical protein
MTLSRKNRSSRNVPARSPLEVLVGGGDHAHVHLDRPRRAEPLDLALLEHAQHLGLRLQAHVADLVEEDRAAVGLLELADLLLGGAGERPLLVAEQLRLDQLLGDGRAVHLHEPLAAPQAVAVDRARHQLLADAALAEDQHGGVGRRRALDRVESPAQRRALAHHLVRARRRACSERFSSRSSRAARARCGWSRRTRSLSSGFSMKSNAPSLVASTAVLTVPWPEIITTGSARRLARAAQRLEPVHARHLDVEEDEVGRLALDGGEPVLARSRRRRPRSPRTRGSSAATADGPPRRR